MIDAVYLLRSRVKTRFAREVKAAINKSEVRNRRTGTRSDFKTHRPSPRGQNDEQEEAVRQSMAVFLCYAW